MWDVHLHSLFSGDSEADPEDNIKAAVEKGLDGICFTDHEDLDYPDMPDFFQLDLAAYQKRIMELKERYSHRIKILWGMELGLQPHLAETHTALLQEWPFDFVIGSSHLLNGYDPYFYDQHFSNWKEEDVYMAYFESILENIRAFDDFDIYGHLDYIVRYGPNKNKYYSYEKYAAVIDEILSLLIEKGKGIELNTGGLKYGLGHPNPTEDVIRRYYELGGRIITTGSDAHEPRYVAYEFEKAAAILKQCGFSHYTVFENRKPVFLPL